MPHLSFSRAGPRGGLTLRLVAEFAVIVMGVLVALAADSWREEREEQQIVEEVLGDIAAQIRAQHYTFGRIGGEVLPAKIAALNRLVLFLRMEDAPLQDSVLLLEDMVRAMGAGDLWLSTDRYEALRSSGLLRLLRDASLGADLADAYSGVGLLLEQADRVSAGFAPVAAQVIPMELAPAYHPMAGYARRIVVPDLSGTPVLSAFVRELRRRRQQLLPLAEAEAWATTNKLTAVERIRVQLANLLDRLEPWDRNAAAAEFELGRGRVDPADPESRLFEPSVGPRSYAEGRFSGSSDLW